MLRPYKDFAQIPMAENAGRSEYNGLQLELNRRFDRGLACGVVYTYSSSYDNAWIGATGCSTRWMAVSIAAPPTSTLLTSWS